jgi:Ger(x)C family germination protein
MHNAHARNTVRYYIIIAVLLLFLFFSNDFGMIDVQKTAIVTAVGIDRVDGDFSVTAQIAIPQSSTSGKSTQSVQIVSKGKTIADAFEEINAKTGWYPKLVFCNLILLGEEACKQDVFDALDYFLLDEYLSDNCLVATCKGKAQNLLNVQALIDRSGSLAMQKVLSEQAERVGTVLPCTLREFTIGYYGESQSSYLPILSTTPQQEHVSNNENAPSTNNGSSSTSDSSSSQNGSDSQNSSESQSSGDSQGESSQNSGNQKQQDKPVFSASETALFVHGKMVGSLTKEETFAFNAVKKKLRLASYEVETPEKATCSLTIRRNTPKTKLTLSDGNTATFHVKLTLTAGLLDYSLALPQEKADAGDVPTGAFAAAEKRLDAQIRSTFEKCRSVGCDLFELTSMLYRQQNARFKSLKTDLLQNVSLQVQVRFQNVR